MVGMLTCYPLYLILVISCHELRWSFMGKDFGKSRKTCFLDKTCIHQTDVEKKVTGIVKLGAFLSLSTRCVVCYTDVYLRKLWTVYEIACFLVIHKIEHMTIIHTKYALMFFFGAIFFWLLHLAGVSGQLVAMSYP